jgi:hypothetical protein
MGLYETRQPVTDLAGQMLHIDSPILAIEISIPLFSQAGD